MTYLFSRFAGVEVGLEDLGDPMATFFQMRAGGVVDGRVAALEHARHAAGDFLEVKACERPGVGRRPRVASSHEYDVAVEIAGGAGVTAQDHVAQPAQVFALEVSPDGRERATLPDLSVAGLDRRSRSEKMPSVSERKTSSIRSGFEPGSD